MVNGKRGRRANPQHNAVTHNEDGSVSISMGKGLCAVIDAGDLAAVALYRWYLFKAKRSTTYYAGARKYVDGKRGPVLLMHRLIAGVKPKYIISHRDGNGLNNRRVNLRPSLFRNGRRKVLSSTGYPTGVYERNGKFRAQMRYNGNLISLGTFDDVETAVKAYNSKVSRLLCEVL